MEGCIHDQLRWRRRFEAARVVKARPKASNDDGGRKPSVANEGTDMCEDAEGMPVRTVVLVGESAMPGCDHRCSTRVETYGDERIS